MGAIPLGHAVETSAGTLPFKSIIHVAGINMLWRSSVRQQADEQRIRHPVAGYLPHTPSLSPILSHYSVEQSWLTRDAGAA
jgi:O-acetyl-ADP-ribose deacetylase (regulator of RNase III)